MRLLAVPGYSAAMERLGALAAFGTALCWSISALFFEFASKRAGALAVNFWKLAFAFPLLCVAAVAFGGPILPLDAPSGSWLYLFVSGLIGFVIADFFLFNAYVLLGSRVTVVFQALQPIFAALISFAFLGETMRPQSLLAMAVVIAGILVTLVARNAAANKASGKASGKAPHGLSGLSGLPGLPMKGVVFAFLSPLFQAAGLIFSKAGLESYNAVGGTQIRVIAGMLGFALHALVTKEMKPVFGVFLADRKAALATLAGGVFGPFLGVTLSLFAVQHTSAGTASTLIALYPVLIILPSVAVLKQRVGASEILGAVIAVSGAALFFLI